MRQALAFIGAIEAAEARRQRDLLALMTAAFSGNAERINELSAALSEAALAAKDRR